MSGYELYFLDFKRIYLGYDYDLEFRGYHAWENEVMSLVRSKHIRLAFRPDVNITDKHDACAQVVYHNVQCKRQRSF